MSRIGQNVRFICHKYKTDLDCVISSNCVSNHMLQMYLGGFKEEDKRIGAQVKELVGLRDYNASDILERQEIVDFIDFLITA